MNSLNHRGAISFALGIFIGLAFLFEALGLSNVIGAGSLLTLFSKAVAVELLLWIAFHKWIWKWPIWQGWLVTVPVIHGTWRGHLYSNWVNPQTGQRPNPIPTQLSIYQTLLTVSCTQRTGESISTSFAEEVRVDSKDPLLIELYYCYRNVPDERVRERSNVHEGACMLRFSQSAGKKLEGSYWTNRRPTPTTGDMRLEFSDVKPLDALHPEMPSHPGPGIGGGNPN